MIDQSMSMHYLFVITICATDDEPRVCSIINLGSMLNNIRAYMGVIFINQLSLMREYE